MVPPALSSRAQNMIPNARTTNYGSLEYKLNRRMVLKTKVEVFPRKTKKTMHKSIQYVWKRKDLRIIALCIVGRFLHVSIYLYLDWG